MAHEYEMLTQVLDVEGWDAPAQSHADAILRIAREWFPQMERTLATMDGGGWEVVSHDVLPLASHAVLSVLVRRETSAQSAPLSPN